MHDPSISYSEKLGIANLKTGREMDIKEAGKLWLGRGADSDLERMAPYMTPELL